MNKGFFYIPALALLAIACQKMENNPAPITEEPVPEVKMITETVSGNRGASAKATISNTNASFAWSIGDNLAVHVSNGDSHKYVVTSKGADAAAASAKFEVTYEEGYSRDAFAIYPSTIVSASAANFGQSGHTLDVTLPGSYTLAQVSGETSPCPMISANEAGSGWDFYQLCGLLRLTVKDIPATAKRLEIDFDGKQVWGDFSVASPVVASTAVISTAEDGAHDTITITKDGSDAPLDITSLTANIPLPVGTYSGITVTAYDAISGGSVILTIARPFAYTASSEKGVKRTASFPSSMKAFRGYEVSTGILKRDASTSPATYSLTAGEMILTADPDGKNEHYALPAGCNPFETAIYFGTDANRGVYFNKWQTLKDELEAGGNNFASSDKLPAGWRFPSAGGTIHSTGADWGNILFGAPKSTITLNGNNVANNAYALVSVTLNGENPYSVAAGTYNGLLLLRDGATITAEHLTQLGYDHNYTDNPLTQAEFGELVKLGCLFISASGYYSELSGFGWRDRGEGNYWSCSSNGLTFSFAGSYGKVSGASKSSTYNSNYQVVKLVKIL